LDPTFLSDAAGFGLPEQTDPRSEQPPRDETAQANENAFPNNQKHDPIGDRAPSHGIESHNEAKMKSADQEEPAKPAAIATDKLKMRANCLP
jgi:hypothetical protein